MLQWTCGGLSLFFRDLLNKANAFAFASCGACGAPPTIKDRVRLEPGLARIFAIQPLGDSDPEAVRATQRGARLLHEGRIEESLRELHDAKRLTPGSHATRSNLGCAYFERGDEDAALHWYREAHRLAPHDDIATLAVAVLEQRAGYTSDAQWLLVNFLQEVNSSHSEALRQLAKLHQEQNHWSQAASCYRRLIAADPTNS